ncbi:UDP-3-O-[3-hydroxymyristoyl] glucosamine N-acyltransferase [Granulicella rosea]|uniref:UDP-3-O-[3-hydroxymyristoyl] glucosamine N-acyltransferase n=1 Tax=Granulicella rosea TaxID=474952 RepID=A0A239J483_9BACT|nr:UDP-3-O-(3-hydroxymyristoyl)glucosamine N-acyltransferase [Granulicella rosea]SNT00609.1 UDP-3-O-[3-hydroxymyristoyl] glucosamine N-acyltransferase [Granulicella rosea]
MAKAKEIAALLGSTTGVPETKIARLASIDDATADAVVFATDKAALALALGSTAGLILASAGSGAEDARVIETAAPRLAFARVYQAFFAPARLGYVHPTAIVEQGVTIGERCWIGPYAVLSSGVSLGSECRIEAGVTIYPGTTLGDRVTVKAGAVLGSTGFGFARDAATGEYIGFPQVGTLAIEDDVEIGANTTIDRGALGETRICKGAKIDNLVHIAHNCRIGRNVVIAAQTGISGSSVVEDGAILGGQVGIGEHATVGAGVILGGGAGVLSGKKMRGPGEVFWGRPARPLKEYLRDLARLKHR